MRSIVGFFSAAVLSISVPALAADPDVAGATLVVSNHTLPLVTFDFGDHVTAAEYHDGGSQHNQVRKIAGMHKGGYATVVVSPDALASLKAVTGGGQIPQTWAVQLAGVQWTLTDARMGSIETPKVGGTATVHITYTTMTVGDAPPASGDTTHSDIRSFDSAAPSHPMPSRGDTGAFTTAADPMDSEGCKDGTLPRLKGYNLNDCDPAQPDTFVFAADTGADHQMSGTKLRLAYAIDETVPVPEAQTVLDDYAGLLKQRGWTITHQDDLSITAHMGDGGQWVEVSVNGGGNYQIVYVTPQ